MSKVRTCRGYSLNTGQSACPYDRDKIVGAILVAHGQKLPSELSGSTLESLCHAARPERVMPILRFVEYAKNGGEVQVSANGYGPNEASDVSQWTDSYTLDKYNDNLNAQLLRTMNSQFDVYFFDRQNVVYGYDDGTDALAGFPMSCVYPTATPYPTSGAKPSLVVNFSYVDARSAMENANFEQLDFNIDSFAYGLVPVKWVSVAANKYKLVEAVGGLDRTAEFGSLIASNAAQVLNGTTTGVAYDAETETITITGTPSLKAPSALYTAGIKGIEQAA